MALRREMDKYQEVRLGDGAWRLELESEFEFEFESESGVKERSNVDSNTPG